MFIKQSKRIITIALLAIFLGATLASAHAAIVWAYVENGQVFVEGFFANGKKIQNSRVVILDASEKIIQEGETDIDGKFHYTPKSLKTQTIVVVASQSHTGNFELSEEELSAIKPSETK